jgi:hypothetical protein
LNVSCSNEPVEFTINNEEEGNGVEDEEVIDPEEEIIYATAKLDGQNFYGNQFQVDTLSSEKIQLSFFSALEQQVFLVLPNPPVQGTYTIEQNNEDMAIYSGAFVNSVGNISESIFYSTADTGQITINSINNETGFISGNFEFDTATFNNNIIVITDGEFEVENE